MPSRRDVIRLNDTEIRNFLDQQQTLIIVSNGPQGYPHPLPMWFVQDHEGCLWVTTFEKAQKVTNFARDRRASLLVESGTVYENLKAVLIYAKAEIVSEREAVLDTLIQIGLKGADVGTVDLEKRRKGAEKTAAKRVALKFTPERYISWDHGKLGGTY